MANKSEKKLEKTTPRLKKLYLEKVRPWLVKELNLKNIMEAPKLEKIVVNIGIGEATQSEKVLEQAVEDLSLITGQRPIITRAKKSVSGFKLRQGMAIGCKVTLRGDRMYEFFDRLVNVALPRVRDFRGLSVESFDGRGNYNFGVEEQYIFPEIDLDKSEKALGMDICIVTSTEDDEEARFLLEGLGFPFRKKPQAEKKVVEGGQVDTKGA